MMDWLLTIHGVGNVTALTCFSEEPFLFKDKTRMIEIFGTDEDKLSEQMQLKNFFTKIKSEKERIKSEKEEKEFVLKKSITIELIDFAKNTLLNGMNRFPAKYIKNAISCLETNDAKVLGSYFRNIESDENFLCGDIDVLIPLVVEEKWKMIKDKKSYIEGEKSKRINQYITAMKEKFGEQGFDIQDIVQIDKGKKFRKLIVPLQNDKGGIFHVRMDVKCGCIGPEYQSMMLHQIGSSEFNTFCSKRALERGLKLSQLGLVVVKNKGNFPLIETCSEVNVINVTNQQELFGYLGIPINTFGSKEFPKNYVNRNKKIDYDSLIKHTHRCELALKLIHLY